MLRPLQKNILKNKLKIDQYQTQTYKGLDQNPLVIARSIILAKDQTQQPEQKRRHSKKIKFNLDHQQPHFHCSRQQRHKSNNTKSSIKFNKQSAIRIKKSFTTVKLLTNTSILEKEDKNIVRTERQNLKSGENISQGITSFLTRQEILRQSEEDNFQISGQNFKKLTKYLISFKLISSSDKGQDTLTNKQDIFIKELDQYLKSQLSQDIEDHFNHFNRIQRQFHQMRLEIKNYNQNKRNKETILLDLKRKVQIKSQQLQILQEKINFAKTVLQKYEGKTFHIDHYLNKLNKAYIEQLCLSYHKHLEDLNSCSILVQAEEEKISYKQSFEQIEQDIKEQLGIITQAFVGNQKIYQELCFVKSMMLRVMGSFRTKHDLLIDIVNQKTARIAQLIYKTKKLAEFTSFKQEYLQKLTNQFNLTIIRANCTVDLLKKKVENKENEKKTSKLVQKLQQLRALQEKLAQNYGLTGTFQ